MTEGQQSKFSPSVAIPSTGLRLSCPAPGTFAFAFITLGHEVCYDEQQQLILINIDI